MKTKSGYRKKILLLPLLLFILSCVPKPTADLVLLNGKIVTVDEIKTEVQAVAVHGEIILAVGNNDEIEKFIGPQTRQIDLAGRLVVPGFIDSHAHFQELGQAQMELDLSRAVTWVEIVDMVGAAVQNARPGDWIRGWGWHQEKWQHVPQPNVDGLPFHTELSRVSPDNPVLLSHASGHSAIANELAMKLAQINNQTPDPKGGQIVRDRTGHPIGVFLETAISLVETSMKTDLKKRSPEQQELDKLHAIELATQECLSKGITTFHDASASFADIDLYKKLALNNRLNIRLWVMISAGNQQLAEKLGQYKIINAGQNRLTVRAIKCFIDGALGSHSAWLLEPYSDLPASTGLNTTPLAELTRTAELALINGFQMCTHAIGDRGNREILNIYEKVLSQNPNGTELRWRIEHAQHLNPADIPRFARLGVLAAMQGVYATSDGPWVVKRLGEKRTEEGAYVWEKLRQTGVNISNGTDAPVEDVNPLACFYASVSRRLNTGEVFYPAQRMSREFALRTYTINGACAGFEEKIKGSITPGKLADMVVLSQDIMTIPEEQVPETEVAYTILGGKVVYEKKN